MYPNQRWRKYMMNLRRKSSKNQLRFLGHHWCREWNKNKKYGDRLKEFNVFYMREETLLNYKVAPIHKRTVWTHWCFGEKAK